MKLPVLIVIVIAIIIGGYFLVRGTSSNTPNISIDTAKKEQASAGLPFEKRESVNAVIKTEKGDIALELYPINAPKTATVFATLAVNGFYDGTLFHRVEPDFVIQGGDPLTKERGIDDPDVGKGGPGFTFEDEINPRSLGLADNIISQLEARGYKYNYDLESIPMDTGVIAMANAGPNTNGSQFFIVLNGEKAKHLNGMHTVFGRVVKGMDVVRSIKKGDKIVSIEIQDNMK